MKRFFNALAVLAAFLSTGAMASTYQIDNTQANAYFYADHTTRYNWNLSGLTLNVNDSNGTARLYGNMVSCNCGTQFTLDVTFTDPYTSGANQKWGDFRGTITNRSTGSVEVIRDMGVGRAATDAVLGINAAPYNPNTTKLEFGFWAYNAGNKRHDFNVTLTCTSGTGASGAANANGTCTSGNNGGQVPLPGTLALVGLAAMGLGARRIKLS